jgi:hypothetical protein
MDKARAGRPVGAKRCGLGLVAALQILMVAGAAGAGPYHPPRDRHGHPDLQGLWINGSMTPLQRPEALKSLVVTAAEAAAWERGGISRFDAENAPLSTAEFAPPPPDQVADDAAQWRARPTHLAQIDGQFRSSIIVEPADGVMPLRPEVRAAASAASAADLKGSDNPEDRHFGDRCLLSTISQQPPYMRQALQIVQTADQVVLLGEANHDARIVRLGDRRHPSAAITPWMGDSVGWWDGDTLVVETTNFNPRELWHRAAADWVPIGAGARVIERFTRTAPDTILYRFEVTDPANYTQTWRGEALITAMAGRIFVYACHEGNYSLPNILAGRRREEGAAGR